MKTYLDCIPCFVRQSLEAARMATDDEEVHKEILDKVMKDLRENSLEGKKPPDIADRVHFIVRKLTGGTDPYKEMKEKQNERAMYLYPELKNIVRDSEDKLYTAVKLAITGNIIDLGPGHEINVEKTVKNVIDKDLEIDNFDEFKEELDKAENIFYLADNAGEIVFEHFGKCRWKISSIWTMRPRCLFCLKYGRSTPYCATVIRPIPTPRAFKAKKHGVQYCGVSRRCSSFSAFPLNRLTWFGPAAVPRRPIWRA